jgi:septum site-determining protein MinC
VGNGAGVLFKWKNDMFLISVDETLTDGTYDISGEISKKLTNSKSFFKNSKIRAAFENENLSEKLKAEILAQIERETKCKIELCENAQSVAPPQGKTAENAEETSQISAATEKTEENFAKVHKGTLRSGQFVGSEKSLIILGDVNPGAEIQAAGDVYVFGSLRGIVHAGSSGDKSAVIIALKLSPTQIRIADIITRPPDADETLGDPEVAFVQNGQILIKKYSQKRNIY